MIEGLYYVIYRISKVLLSCFGALYVEAKITTQSLLRDANHCCKEVLLPSKSLDAQ